MRCEKSTKRAFWVSTAGGQQIESRRMGWDGCPSPPSWPPSWPGQPVSPSNKGMEAERQSHRLADAFLHPCLAWVRGCWIRFGGQPREEIGWCHFVVSRLVDTGGCSPEDLEVQVFTPGTSASWRLQARSTYKFPLLPNSNVTRVWILQLLQLVDCFEGIPFISSFVLGTFLCAPSAN